MWAESPVGALASRICVQCTVAETITLTALWTRGDPLSPSVASSAIDNTAGPSTQFIVETAADDSGTAVGDTLLIPGEELDAFANLHPYTDDAASGIQNYCTPGPSR